MRAIQLRSCLAAYRLGAVRAPGHDLRLGQHGLGIAGKAEIRIHQMRDHPAAVAVHILPHAGSYAVGAVAACLIHRRIVTEQHKERRQQAGLPAFCSTKSCSLK